MLKETFLAIIICSGINAFRFDDVGNKFFKNYQDNWVKPWNESGIIPDVIAKPPRPLAMSFTVINPGVVVSTPEVLKPPTVRFFARPNAYYTVIDLDIDADTGVEDNYFVHYLAHNLEAKKLDEREERFGWLPPVTFNRDANDPNQIVAPDPANKKTNRHITLVYQQSEKIDDVGIESNDECVHNYDITNRIDTLANIISTYDLDKLVAGNMYSVIYDDSAYLTICKMAECNPGSQLKPPTEANCP